MSKFTEQLRTIRIFNPHNLVATGHPFIVREAYQWVLKIVGDDTSRTGKHAFYDYGNVDWRAAITAPLAKCKELFPDLEMVKGPWPNTYVPKVDLDAAKAKLKVG